MKKRIGFLFAMLAMLALLAMALGSGVALADDSVVPIPGIEVAAVEEATTVGLVPKVEITAGIAMEARAVPRWASSEYAYGVIETSVTVNPLETTALASTVPRVAIFTLVAIVGLGVLALTIFGTALTTSTRRLGSRIRTFTGSFSVAFGLKRLARGHPQYGG